MALERLLAGEVVAIPTDTVYGVAVIPAYTHALFALKERPTDVALPVLIAEPTDAASYATFAVDLTDCWPGALTIVGTRTGESREWDLGGDPSTIGLRCPDDDDLRGLLRLTGPLVTTSANKHGEPPCTTAPEVHAALGDDIFVINGGVRDGRPSTVVDATQSPVRVLRQGAVVIG
ncbi:MAG: L-threonylcarbamoyladenylate synthase [Actinomycetota bacterium]|jgi:tRNA threonylcarbamoyl adenosine modification protein (Sua5/YciO/YrdC/YwlC family)